MVVEIVFFFFWLMLITLKVEYRLNLPMQCLNTTCHTAHRYLIRKNVVQKTGDFGWNHWPVGFQMTAKLDEILASNRPEQRNTTMWALPGVSEQTLLARCVYRHKAPLPLRHPLINRMQYWYHAQPLSTNQTHSWIKRHFDFFFSLEKFKP